MEKLKCCPFCGSVPTLSKHESRSFGTTWQVGCDNVDCPVEAGTCGYTGNNGEASAIAHWNTRITPEPTPLPEDQKREAARLMTAAILREAFAIEGIPLKALWAENLLGQAALNALLERFQICRRNND